MKVMKEIKENKIRSKIKLKPAVKHRTHKKIKNKTKQWSQRSEHFMLDVEMKFLNALF